MTWIVMPILKCLVPIIYCKSLELHIIANKSFIAVLYCLALYQFDNAMVSYFLFSQWFVDELTGSPINIILLLIIGFLIYKLLKPESGKYYYLCQLIEKLSKPIKRGRWATCFQIRLAFNFRCWFISWYWTTISANEEKRLHTKTT